MKNLEKYKQAEAAVLEAVIKVCESYPTGMSDRSDGEFLSACAKLLRVLFEEKRAL